MSLIQSLMQRRFGCCWNERCIRYGQRQNIDNGTRCSECGSYLSDQPPLTPAHEYERW